MKISELKLTDIKTTKDKEDLVFANIDQPPFRIYGVEKIDGCYRRIPGSVADKCNDGVKAEKMTSSGGRVRFVTNSSYISVRVTLIGARRMWTMSDIITSGMDVYIGKRYKDTVKNSIIFNPASGEVIDCVTSGGAGSAKDIPEGVDIAYEWMVNLGDTKGQTVTLNFPAYNGVKDVYIGFKSDSEISHAPDYSLEKPILFYGSSITQGADASRPGVMYQNFLSRELDFNYHNLGFSGGAKADDAISDYIADFDVSAFVYDYDHNAPSAEYLSGTHEKMFLKFRKAHPKTPVLMLSRPYSKLDTDIAQRQEIIKKTYENAKARGDANVYLLLGSEYFPNELGGDFSIDNCHPNDIGFMYMAKAIAPIIKEIIEKVK